MSNRREFLRNFSGATAGIVAGAGLAGSAFGWLQAQALQAQTQQAQAQQAPGQQPGPRGKRKEIWVGGRRARTVDCFCHINVPDMWKVIPPDHPLPLQMQGAAKKMRSEPIPQFDPHSPDMEKILSAMDTMGIDIAVAGVGATYWAEQSLSRDLTRVQNEKIAKLCAAYPDRFRGFGTLSLQYPDLAVKELEEGVKLKMVGFTVGGSVNGKELSSPEFHPVWAKAEQLGTVIFLRGGGLNGISDQTRPYPNPRFEGHGWLASVIGGPLEITLALSHLIEEGTLDRFPGLKILCAGGGGYIIESDAMADKCGPYFPDFCQQVKKHPKEYYLKRLYFDSMHRTPEELRHLIATVGIGQVVLSTDNAQAWNSEAVDRVLAVPGLTDADRIAILGGNASKLLGLGS